jgi:hypothetical protein
MFVLPRLILNREHTWERSQIEDRLRDRPDLFARYRDIVDLSNT